MQNILGLQESALLTMGGVVSEVNAFDVPAGSAAVATDCDFTVASVKTRDGLEQVYAYAGNSQTRTPGVGSNNASSGTIAWTNPNNIVTATATSVAVTSGALSELLQASTYGFTIPSTSFVQGIEVAVTGLQSSTGSSVAFDGHVANGAIGAPASAPYTIGTLTPTATDFGMVFGSALNNANFYINQSVLPPTGFTPFQVGSTNAAYGFFSTANITSPTTVALNLGAASVFDYIGVFLLLQSNGSPSIVQTSLNGTQIANGGGNTVVYSSNVTAGNALIFCAQVSSNGTSPVWSTPTDTQGNVYTQLGTFVQANAFGFDHSIVVYGALASATGANTITYAISNYTAGTGLGWATEVTGISSSAPLAGFSISPNFAVPGATTHNWQFGLTSSTITFGGVADLWGMTPGGWNLPSIVNTPNFGFSIQATEPSGPTVTFDISNVVVTVFYTPPASTQFDYIKSFEMTDGDTLTLALDSTGIFWQEDLLSTPGVLTPFYTAIEPNTFARSTTIDDREFIALSDLSMGTDMPRQYNGQWVDRLSQIGPAAPPSISSTSTTYNVVSITQPAAVSIDGASGHGGVQWTSGVNSHTPGNVIIPYTDNPNFLNGVSVGSVVFLQLTGAGLAAGDGTYFVTSTGSALGMESGDGESFMYFTVTGPSTQQLNVHTDPVSPGTYQLTVATLTVSAPVPGLTVGSQITLSGVSPGTWNGTWTISNVVNGASLEITSTQLTSDAAIYGYTVTSGSAGAVVTGAFVTITGCTNGPVVNGQSIFNQYQAQISSVSPGFFTISPVNAANVPLAPETTAVALVLGTIFQFDPGINDVGTATNPILGNGSGGSLVIAGGLGAGLRQAVVMFETRNGFITQPSPPVSFNLSANANQITATNLPIGPPNVIRRIVAFTGANGGFFFYIPQPVTVVSSGQTVTYTSTVINDNTSSQATFNFTDTILLSSISIDSQGNNLFAQKELGSSIGVVAYSQRLFAWGEQNKILNLLNYSFDGGYLAQSPTTPLQPLGWTVDPVNGAGGSLTVSPLFGDAYQISNTSGSTQALYGMITQPAFQDYLKTPIFNVQTKYSVRVTASCPLATASGNLVIDLFSPGFQATYGSFVLPLSSLTTTMSINTGTLLTTAFQTSVPQDLLIRVYAQNIPNNGQVLIDRFEPFDTSEPTLTTQLAGSYFDNFEAFDTITGNLGVAAENQQPIRNAFELFDTLYIVKTHSFNSSSDNGTTEPSGWTVREVSNKVGTPSIYLVDVGEGWALVGGEAGLYLFSGGEPIKINPELDGDPGIWQSLLWSEGQKFWLRNDTEKRKIYIGACMPTPNVWAPRFPVNANPTQPNVVLVCTYKELMSSGALANEGPVRLSYTGELKSWALGRKWSIWSVEACYADFIDRPDNSQPIFFCSDQGPQIFEQIPGLYSDNGLPMHWNYISYAFPKSSEAEQKQMGLSMLDAHQMNLLVQGNGQLRMNIIPNDLRSQDAISLYPEPLANPTAYGDMEIPILQVGNRFFPEFYVTDVGEWAELSRIVMWLGAYAWAPSRGSNT